MRYKKKDEGINKFNFVTHSEWTPKPGDLSASLSSVSAEDPNKHTTPLIDMSESARCNRTVIVNGVCDTVTTENVKEVFSSFFSKKDHDTIEDIMIRSKGIVLITCKEWSASKTIVENYQKHKLLDKEVRLSLFRDNDPSA